MTTTTARNATSASRKHATPSLSSSSAASTSNTTLNELEKNDVVDSIPVSYAVQDAARERLYPWTASSSSSGNVGDRDAIPHEYSPYWTDYARNYVTSLPAPVVSAEPGGESSSSSSSSLWPSVNMITFFNTRGTLSCATTSRFDCRTVVAGFEDSSIRVYSSKGSSSSSTATGHRQPRTTPDGQQNSEIRDDDDDEDENNEGEALGGIFGKRSSLLIGHSGTVYSLSLWDEDRLLSCSQDGTVRFWALCERPLLRRAREGSSSTANETQEGSGNGTTTAATVPAVSIKDARISEAKRFKFRGAGGEEEGGDEEDEPSSSSSEPSPPEWQNVFTINSQGWWSSANFKYQCPIWDVKFAPFGYYFTTASDDGGIRLFSTER